MVRLRQAFLPRAAGLDEKESRRVRDLSVIDSGGVGQIIPQEGDRIPKRLGTGYMLEICQWYFKV